MHLLDGCALSFERCIFSLELRNSILKVLHLLYMLHICVGDQTTVTQTDPTLTGVSWPPWLKTEELWDCICKGGHKNDNSLIRLLTWYDDPWFICELPFHAKIGVTGGKRGI